MSSKSKTMAAVPKIKRPKSLTDIAVEHIRASIIEGSLNLGGQISEAALALQLGISKTPVREALIQLASMGLVVIRPRRGAVVADTVGPKRGSPAALAFTLKHAEALSDRLLKRRIRKP